MFSKISKVKKINKITTERFIKNEKFCLKLFKDKKTEIDIKDKTSNFNIDE